MTVLTRQDLDGQKCYRCDNGEPCDHTPNQPLYIHSVCHPSTTTWTHYLNGVLTVECAQCGTAVTKIAVAAS